MYPLHSLPAHLPEFLITALGIEAPAYSQLVCVSKDVKAGLIHPYHDWKTRIATLRFVEDIPLNPKHPSYATLTEVEKGLELFKNHPMLILWGDQDFCFTPNFRKIWEQKFPKAQTHAWNDVGHYVMEDAPERSTSLMKTFWESVT